MKELIKIEVTVKLEYDDKKYRAEGIKDAKRIVLDSMIYGCCAVIPIKSKLIKSK